ncbi:putative phosphoesterase protein [Haloplasma contractile SSD-17B]|uniref:Phosphoesterase protein n=1 Tax=Haloplasma contractile SSD-17B TaxID=1033810 RepID=U2FHX8_9MOLU|nr:putative phosphoesterase protein [Haloplasma contractile SSD-17B]
MKVMFVSDIHGSLNDTIQMIEVFNKEGADKLIVLGDILYHGPRNPLPSTYNPSEVEKLLNQYSQRIISIRGNCDSEVDQMVLEFEMMQDHSHLLLDDYHFFLTHGHKF